MGDTRWKDEVANSKSVADRLFVDTLANTVDSFQMYCADFTRGSRHFIFLGIFRLDLGSRLR